MRLEGKSPIVTIRRTAAQRFRSTSEFTAIWPAVYPDSKIPHRPTNFPVISTCSLILSSLLLFAKAATLAVYPDTSPWDISCRLTGGISRYQPALHLCQQVTQERLHASDNKPPAVH